MRAKKANKNGCGPVRPRNGALRLRKFVATVAASKAPFGVLPLPRLLAQ
jgi:hypothetical protein